MTQKVSNDMLLAGVGTSANNLVALDGSGNLPAVDGSALLNVGGAVLQVQTTFSTTQTSTSTVMPDDNTIPQITEGGEFMTCAITPTAADSTLLILAMMNFGADRGGDVSMALFVDSTANALASSQDRNQSTSTSQTQSLTHAVSAGSTSARTYRIRAGLNQAGTMWFNRPHEGARHGGVLTSSIIIFELGA